MKNTLLLLFVVLFIFSCKEGSSDIITTEGGYQYQVIEKGNGQKAAKGDFAYFEVDVVSLEGDVVFSTREQKQPGVMKLDLSTEEAPNPFGDILLDKNVGDSIHIYLGKETGAQGSGFDSLIYKMRLSELVDEATYNERMAEEQKKAQAEMALLKEKEGTVATMVEGFYADLKAGRLDDKIVTTESGLKYVMQKEGTGEKYKNGDVAVVYYYGVLSRTGEMFDNSYQRGQPFSFPVGQGRVIKGWDEGVTFLNQGAQAFFIIPSELGYGERDSGKIKAGDELIFFIEVPE
jgi:FKBP-type peptidyl-prolyl cis-trans isomerase